MRLAQHTKHPVHIIKHFSYGICHVYHNIWTIWNVCYFMDIPVSCLLFLLSTIHIILISPCRSSHLILIVINVCVIVSALVVVMVLVMIYLLWFLILHLWKHNFSKLSRRWKALRFNKYIYVNDGNSTVLFSAFPTVLYVLTNKIMKTAKNYISCILTHAKKLFLSWVIFIDSYRCWFSRGWSFCSYVILFLLPSTSHAFTRIRILHRN